MVDLHTARSPLFVFLSAFALVNGALAVYTIVHEGWVECNSLSLIMVLFGTASTLSPVMLVFSKLCFVVAPMYFAAFYMGMTVLDAPEDCVNVVNRSIERGGKVVAVGTSVIRAMESTHSTYRQLKTYDGWTSRFIFPPYKFKLADALITNFHTPQSTLLMLTAAFGGYDLIMEAYQTAIKEKYRMHAYGDALLVI